MVCSHLFYSHSSVSFEKTSLYAARFHWWRSCNMMMGCCGTQVIMKKSTDPRIFVFVFHSLWQQLLTILISQHEQNDHKLEEQYSLCDGWNNRQTLTGIVPLKVILKSYKEADMSVYPWGSSGNHITQQPEAWESESGQRTDWDKQTIQLEHRSHTGKEKKRATANAL